MKRLGISWLVFTLCVVAVQSAMAAGKSGGHPLQSIDRDDFKN